MAGKGALVMQRGALLVAGMLLLAACSGSSSDPTTSTTSAPTTSTTTTTTTTSTTTTTTTTSTTTTTTTAAPTTTGAPEEKLVSNFDRDSVDEFNTNIDDPLLAALELDDLFNYLEGNPTGSAEEMVDLMFTDDYSARAEFLESFAELADNDWHYVDPGNQQVAVALIEARGDTAVLQMASKRGEQLIADGTGEIVKTYAGYDLQLTEYTIERGADGRWRWAIPGTALVASSTAIEQMVPIEWTGRR